MYEEVEGLQVLPETEAFFGKFPGGVNGDGEGDDGGGSGGGGNLVAVAGKNGVVRVLALQGQVPIRVSIAYWWKFMGKQYLVGLRSYGILT